MSGVRVGSELTVDIIVFDQIDQVLGQSSIHWKSVEILLRIVFRKYLNLSLRVE